MKDFKSAVIFDGIADALKNDGANLIQKVKGIFGFKVKGPNGDEVLWIVDAKNGSGKVEVNGKGTNFWYRVCHPISDKKNVDIQVYLQK